MLFPVRDQLVVVYKLSNMYTISLLLGPYARTADHVELREPMFPKDSTPSGPSQKQKLAF